MTHQYADRCKKKSLIKKFFVLGNGRKTSVPIEIEGAPSLGETARAVDDSLFLTMNEAIRMARGVRVATDTTDAQGYFDFLHLASSLSSFLA